MRLTSWGNFFHTNIIALIIITRSIGTIVLKEGSMEVGNPTLVLRTIVMKHFFIYRININIPYPITLLEFGLPPIESKAMIKYLMYKHKVITLNAFP